MQEILNEVLKDIVQEHSTYSNNLNEFDETNDDVNIALHEANVKGFPPKV